MTYVNDVMVFQQLKITFLTFVLYGNDLVYVSDGLRIDTRYYALLTFASWKKPEKSFYSTGNRALVSLSKRSSASVSGYSLRFRVDHIGKYCSL